MNHHESFFQTFPNETFPIETFAKSISKLITPRNISTQGISKLVSWKVTMNALFDPVFIRKITAA